jgi:hypothetical protein
MYVSVAALKSRLEVEPVSPQTLLLLLLLPVPVQVVLEAFTDYFDYPTILNPKPSSRPF